MNKKPIAVVVTHDHLLAYMLYPDGCAAPVERIEFQSDAQTHRPGADLKEGGTLNRSLALDIGKILDRYRPETWHLVCRDDQSAEILKNLENDHNAALAGCLANDSLDINIANISEYFGCRPSFSSPELQGA